MRTMRTASTTLSELVEETAERGIEFDPATADFDDSGWVFVVIHVRDSKGRPSILRCPGRSHGCVHTSTTGARFCGHISCLIGVRDDRRRLVKLAHHTLRQNQPEDT